MTGSGGRHARPDEPDESDAAGDSSGITPPTEPLPIVRREGPETRHVRAVARRVPSALPALGGDEIPDKPPSVRAAIDRRRRAREMATGAAPMGQPPATPPAPSSSPAASPSPAPSSSPGPAPSSMPAPVSAAAPEPSPSPAPQPRPEPATGQTTASAATPSGSAPDVAPADVELVPVGSRSRAVPPAPAPPSDRPNDAPAAASVPPMAEPAPAAEPAAETRPAGAARPTTEPERPDEEPAPVPPELYAAGAAAPPAPPAGHHPAEPAVGEQPSAEDAGTDTDTGAPAAEASDAEAPEDDEPVIENRPPYVLPDAQTDEWVSVPAPQPASAPLVVPSRPPELAPSDRWESPSDRWETSAEAPVGRHAAPTYEPSAPGPSSATGQPAAVSPREPADTAPLPPVTDEYRGRRRARHRARRGTPRWLVVVGVLAVLLLAVAVPFLVADPAANESEPGATPEATPSATAMSPSAAGTPDSATSQPGAPVIVAPTATPTPSPTPTPTPSATSATPTSAEPWTLTLEAESPDSAVGGGAAKVGGVVDFLGQWRRRGPEGWLEFRAITVPEAGQYRLRVFHRYAAYCGCQPRRLGVWVNGSHVTTWEFTEPDPGVREITVTLGAGENTIRLTHDRSASPAIDRIEITRP